MRWTRVNNLGPRLAVGAVLILASIALGGCGTGATHTSPSTSTSPTPRPTVTASNFTLAPTLSAGVVYTDALTGYAVTFPGPPEVKPLAISGTHRLGNIAFYGDSSTIVLLARGEARDSAPNLQGELYSWVQGAKPTGVIRASGDELAGLPAAQAQFPQGSQQVQTIMANDGDRFYQLIASGGTAHQRKAFFDSYHLTSAAHTAAGQLVKGTGYSVDAPQGWSAPAAPAPKADIFIAGKKSDSHGYVDTLNVLLSRPSGKTLATIEYSEETRLVQDFDATDVQLESDVSIAGTDSGHVSGQVHKDGLNGWVDQYLLLHHGTLYTISFTWRQSVAPQDRDAIADPVLAAWKWS